MKWARLFKKNMRRLLCTLSLLLVFAMVYYAVGMNWTRNPNVIDGNPSNIFDSGGSVSRVATAKNQRAGLNDGQFMSAPGPAPNLQSKSTPAEPAQNVDEESSVMTTITITVNGSVFVARTYDNSAARALLAQFPMALTMSDLNGNEKYYHLTAKLPSKSTERPAIINAGDIMCWSGNSLVLFYKTFSNSYGGYVRLGYVEDAAGLAAALGSGSVQVSFTISE